MPASDLCRDNQGKPYILGIHSAKDIIVEMYGEDPKAYRTREQILEGGSNSEVSSGYPNKDCPRFPNLATLRQAHPSVNFYLEKTLQQEEPGYLGQEFETLLQQNR